MNLNKKNYSLIILVLAFLLTLISLPTQASVKVMGYYRKNGTYVSSHYRSNPDRSRVNNWSAKGNYNPYTGKKGTINPYKNSSYRRK